MCVKGVILTCSSQHELSDMITLCDRKAYEDKSQHSTCYFLHQRTIYVDLKTF